MFCWMCSLCDCALTTWETTSELYRNETRAVLDWKLFTAAQVTTTPVVVVVVVAVAWLSFSRVLYLPVQLIVATVVAASAVVI